MNEKTPGHDTWSPLSTREWIAVFVAGFCAMVLFFFRFYAGVFAVEAYEERNLEVAMLTRLVLDGTLPLSTGFLSAAAVFASLTPPISKSGVGRKVALALGLAIGLIGVAATLWGIYAPLVG